MILLKSFLKLNILVIFIANIDCFATSNIKGFEFDDSNEILNYTIIKPQIYNTRTKRSISNATKSDVHTNEITLTYRIENENINLKLHLNQEILNDDYFLSIQNLNGTGNIVTKVGKGKNNLCNYQGFVEGKPKSNVAVSTCNGHVNGIVFDGSKTYYIYSPNQLDANSYLIKSTDVKKKGKCGVDPSDNHNQLNELKNLKIRQKRNVLFKTKEKLYVELVLVVDNSLYKSFNSDVKETHQYCKELVNIINSLYQPLRIYIALIGVEIWTKKDEVPVNGQLKTLLDHFKNYRKTKLLSIHKHDNAILLTNKRLSGNIVGYAFVGTMCASDSCGVVVRHSQLIGVVAATISHEMGHNFGMKHDEEVPKCKCLEKTCIMASKSAQAHYWSTCSKDQITSFYSSGKQHCLYNIPEKIFGSSTCGNGIVEPGEDCDCGLPKFCNNKCCDARTCKFSAHSVCATGECCDLSKCQLKKLNTRCRIANGECDLSEYCTGKSEYCPLNLFKQNGTPCYNNQTYCYNGTCGLRDVQCQQIYGLNAISEKSCYENNLEGTAYGNCGMNSKLKNFNKCNQKDFACGSLQCTNRRTKTTLLEINNNITNYVKYTMTYSDAKGPIKICHTTDLDNEFGSYPVLSVNGARCGINKMCVNQKCIEIKNLNQKNCPQDCNGNGLCNKEGKCKCFKGFLPPFCKPKKVKPNCNNLETNKVN